MILYNRVGSILKTKKQKERGDFMENTQTEKAEEFRKLLHQVLEVQKKLLTLCDLDPPLASYNAGTIVALLKQNSTVFSELAARLESKSKSPDLKL